MANPYQPSTMSAHIHAKHSVNNSDWVPGNQHHNPQSSSLDPSLDPSLPSFQPRGMHLQHYQASQQPKPFQSALQAGSMSVAMSEMHRRLLELNTYHFHDIVKLNRQGDQHGEAIEEIKESFTNDMRVLEQRINAISQQQEKSATKLLKTKDDFSPSEQMLNMFSKEKIAEAYLDEAEEKEAWAEKLREQAGLLWPACIAEQTAQAQTSPIRNLGPGHLICETKDALIEVIAQHVDEVQAKGERADSAYGSPVRASAVTPPAQPFACCEVQYQKVEDLVRHVELSHPYLLKVYSVNDADRAREIRGTQETGIANHNMIPAKLIATDDDVNSTTTTASSWTPLAIRNFDPQPVSARVTHHIETFTWSFLKELLGGKEWTPGYFFNGSKKCILPTRGYWLVDIEHEPFMPRTPGQHGAKLTAFFNQTTEGKCPELKHYMKTPVFVSANRGKSYRYMGTYSQARYSDKVGYDTLMEHVPEVVRRHHAEQLAKVGRAGWVTESLREAFWPKPTYTGPTPTDSACNTPKTIASQDGSDANLERHVKQALEAYAQELKEWEKDSAMKVQHLEVEGIAAAFAKEDTQLEPGLRLWWEYLQCVGYDDDFYEMLVKLQKQSKRTGTHIGIGSEPTSTLHQTKKAEESKKAGKAPVATRSKAENDWDYITPPQSPPPALYGACSKALQRKLARERPGVDAASLPATQWSTPSYTDDMPTKATVVQQQLITPKKATINEPFSEPSASASTEGPKTAPTKAVPPHLAARKAKAATPKSPSINNEAEAKKANPFASSGDLDAAKQFAEQATVARGKKVAPHMRGK